jgi:hypothetical protein
LDYLDIKFKEEIYLIENLFFEIDSQGHIRATDKTYSSASIFFQPWKNIPPAVFSAR